MSSLSINPSFVFLSPKKSNLCEREMFEMEKSRKMKGINGNMYLAIGREPVLFLNSLSEPTSRLLRVRVTGCRLIK